ncbi:glycosyl transferase, group 2 family protein [Shewanella violacea DSS12]|uniref:Glycosyl transferase, group 2 family protein n=1 Tax=Shewanella violacea (strain JCM 10179 / CIP 106290 / LMG 19151 / DSS12) TaxID=637905 RepID=D4ZFZ6_SHEVD|nr:glycosyl transferase, group 2 family protein [Shewanella violacea DSS12]
MVSFIVPFTERSYLPFDARLSLLLTELCSLANCEVILHVTGVISDKYSQVIRQLESSLVVVQQVKSDNDTYSAGQARNHAVTVAKSDYIFFIDADLAVAPELFSQLKARVHKLATIGPFAFEMYPCLYLSQQATVNFKSDFNAYLDSFMQGHNDMAEGIALASSCLLLNRNWFLQLGGFDIEFIGHGGEDFGLIHKLCLHYPISSFPADYADNIKGQHPGGYLGCRRYFSLYALQHLFEGRFLVHLWHSRPLTHHYHKRRVVNDKLLSDKLRQVRLIQQTVTLESTNSLQASCKVTGKVVADLNANFTSWMESNQIQNGYPIENYPGLFKWADNVVIKRTFRRKLRKLYLKPILFFKDMVFKT